MSKERARRRAERQAVAERHKAARARAVARRRWRRELTRRLTPRLRRRRRTGRLFVRRTSGQRAAIVVVTFTALTAVWLAVPGTPLRIVLTAVVLLGLPVFVVVALDRRS